MVQAGAGECVVRGAPGRVGVDERGDGRLVLGAVQRAADVVGQQVDVDLAELAPGHRWSSRSCAVGSALAAWLTAPDEDGTAPAAVRFPVGTGPER